MQVPKDISGLDQRPRMSRQRALRHFTPVSLQVAPTSNLLHGQRHGRRMRIRAGGPGHRDGVGSRGRSARGSRGETSRAARQIAGRDDQQKQRDHWDYAPQMLSLKTSEIHSYQQRRHRQGSQPRREGYWKRRPARTEKSPRESKVFLCQRLVFIKGYASEYTPGCG